MDIDDAGTVATRSSSCASRSSIVHRALRDHHASARSSPDQRGRLSRPAVREDYDYYKVTIYFLFLIVTFRHCISTLDFSLPSLLFLLFFSSISSFFFFSLSLCPFIDSSRCCLDGCFLCMCLFYFFPWSFLAV